MSDLISRQAAIDDIWTVSPIAKLDREWIDRWLRQLPSAQQHIDADGTLWITVSDIEQVKRVIVDEHKSNFCRQFWMDGDGPASCEDVVSREYILEKIDKMRVRTSIAVVDGKKYHFPDWFPMLNDIKVIIKTAPPVTPKQGSGYWILGAQDRVNGIWAKCSACGKTSFGGGSFCRECGAKMKPYNGRSNE